MGCVYSATNKINQKQYVGMSTRSMEIRRIDHEACASERIFACPVFHRALVKYGIENFEWEVLFESDDARILMYVERMMISDLNTVNPFGYNLTGGGEGIFNPCEELRLKLSESGKNRPKASAETRKKLGDTLKRLGHQPPIKLIGTPTPDEIRLKISQTLKGHEVSEESRKKIGESLKEGYASGKIKRIQKPMSDETKEKIRQRTIGKTIAELYGEDKAKEIAEAKRTKMLGTVKSEETREKMSLAQTGRKASEDTKKILSEAQKKRFESGLFSRNELGRFYKKDSND